MFVIHINKYFKKAEKQKALATTVERAL